MRTARPAALLAALLAWASAAPGRPPSLKDLPPAVQEVLKQFRVEARESVQAFQAEVAARRAKAVAELQKVQDDFCREAKLDEALAVREVLRAFQAGTDLPPGEKPAAVREALKRCADDEAAIETKADEEAVKRRERLVAELQKIQDALCREAKLDEAVAVRDLIRRARDGARNVLPDPGDVINQSKDIGKVFYYRVTGVSKEGERNLVKVRAIYGTDVYTTGSHLGMAAVHCGVLKEGQTGVVKVTILPGQGHYFASTRNGVTSYDEGAWPVSFKVERARPLLGKQ
jgi:hypothetical protein